MYILSKNGENNLRYESDDIVISQDGDIIVDGITCRCNIENTKDDDKFDIFVSYMDYQKILKTKAIDRKEEFFVDITTGLVPMRMEDKYPGKTLWIKDDFCYLFHEKRGFSLRDTIKVNYSRIWSVLEKKYDIDFYKIEGFLGKMLLKYFGYDNVKVLSGYEAVPMYLVKEFQMANRVNDDKILDPPKTVIALGSFEEQFILETLGMYTRVDLIKYPKSIFWFIDNKSMIEYRESDGFFRFKYSLWLKLRDNVEINGDYNKLAIFTKKMVNKYFCIQNILTTYNSDTSFEEVDKHFGIMDISDQKYRKIEDIFDEVITDLDRFEDGENFPNRTFFYNDHVCIFEYNSENNYLYMNFHILWSKFLDIYGNNILEMTTAVNSICKRKLDITGDYRAISKIMPWDKIIDEKYEQSLSNSKLPVIDNVQLVIETLGTVKSMKKFVDNKKFPDKIFWFQNDKCVMELKTDYYTLCIHDDFFRKMTESTGFSYMKLKEIVKEESIKLIDPNIKNVVTMQGVGWITAENFFRSSNIESHFEELFLDLISDIVHKHDNKKYMGKDFWFKGKVCVMTYNAYNKSFWINHEHIWVIFEKKFNLVYGTIDKMMVVMVEKHFGFSNVMVVSYNSTIFNEIEQYFFGDDNGVSIIGELTKLINSLYQKTYNTGKSKAIFWSKGSESLILYIVDDKELYISKSWYDKTFLQSKIVDETNFKKKLKEAFPSITSIDWTVNKIVPTENIDKFYKELLYNYKFLDHATGLIKKMTLKRDDVRYPNMMFWFDSDMFLFGYDTVKKYIIVNYAGFLADFKADGVINEKFMNQLIKNTIEHELRLSPLPKKIRRCAITEIDNHKEDTIPFTYNGEYISTLEKFFR